MLSLSTAHSTASGEASVPSCSFTEAEDHRTRLCSSSSTWNHRKYHRNSTGKGGDNQPRKDSSSSEANHSDEVGLTRTKHPASSHSHLESSIWKPKMKSNDHHPHHQICKQWGIRHSTSTHTKWPIQQHHKQRVTHTSYQWILLSNTTSTKSLINLSLSHHLQNSIALIN